MPSRLHALTEPPFPSQIATWPPFRVKSGHPPCRRRRVRRRATSSVGICYMDANADAVRFRFQMVIRVRQKHTHRHSEVEPGKRQSVVRQAPHMQSPRAVHRVRRRTARGATRTPPHRTTRMSSHRTPFQTAWRPLQSRTRKYSHQMKILIGHRRMGWSRRSMT